ncbi:MAG: mechanosensitive ion channel family protein [Spirochaetia bacterium]|nr:mechanosensitive ion channel family protein [Spirochaetia bacterium]
MNLRDIESDVLKIASLPPEMFPLFIITAAAVILVFTVRAFILRLALRRVNQSTSRLLWQRNSAYFSILILMVFLFPVWLPSLRTIAAFLGIFGAGVILVLKEVILNLAGWFFIIIRKPFEIGNRITVGHFSGDVLDIRLMDVSLIEVSEKEFGGQSTGRVIHVPNSFILVTPFANASKEFAFNWNEIRIPISLDSDWKKAVQIVEETTAEVMEPISEGDHRIRHSEREYAIRYKRMTPRVFVEYTQGSIVLTLRHLVEHKTNRMAADRFWRSFLQRLHREKKIKLMGPSFG